jgi:hypothetical protein
MVKRGMARAQVNKILAPDHPGIVDADGSGLYCSQFGGIEREGGVLDVTYGPGGRVTDVYREWHPDRLPSSAANPRQCAEQVVVQQMQNAWRTHPDGKFSAGHILAALADHAPGPQSTDDWQTKYEMFSNVLVRRAANCGLDSESLSKILTSLRADVQKEGLACVPVAAYATDVDREPVWVVAINWEIRLADC